ncbi:uncharacterized protein LOC127811376 [Diospyros lotus]|uniref:uncharacterized protein LOC127811376 n=1 Tax=Diospyros lotus TaxID=55363 RepID=UPI00224EB804|nr:uncharacterized protein LOC127811376 [Diospyros lotus]
MEANHLLHPLLPLSAAATNTFENINVNDDRLKSISSNSHIIIRLSAVVFIGILSVWANHEAAKGFHLAVENQPLASAAGRRFQLFYVSNGKAARLVLNASNFVETLLYPPPNSKMKKQVRRVTLRLAGRNLTQIAAVESVEEQDFLIHLSPSVMEQRDVDSAMLRALRQAMARVWLYHNNAPRSLVNGMIEYITGLPGSPAVEHSRGGGGGGCWKDDDPTAVARFLDYCEERKRGSIQRLNQAMEGSWHDRTVDEVLGEPAQDLCKSYMSRQHLATRALDSGPMGLAAWHGGLAASTF